MFNIQSLTDTEFAKLPLVIEGESKEVRYIGHGKVVIRFKPTIYSFTANRSGIIEFSDVLRLRATKIFVDILKKNGIKHAYQQVTDKWVLADLILEPQIKNNQAFVPKDLSTESFAKLPIAPPIEVIVKRTHTGTSKHRYYAMNRFSVRESHPFYGGMAIENEGPYPEPIVRFDWRNPLLSSKGDRLEDEILPDTLAHWFIDIKKARDTALKTYDILSQFLSKKDIICCDLCLFITEDGATVFGEISQDCGRFRHFDLESLDKDVWRSGGSSKMVLQKWQLLLDMTQS